MTRTFITNSKAGLLIGTIMGVVVVFWYTIPPASDPLFFHKYVEICLPGILSGGISGAILESFLIKKYILSKQFLNSYKAWGITGSIIGSLIFFPPGYTFSVVFSVPGGVTIGVMIGEKIGMYKIITSAGIVLGIVTITTVITLIGGFIGFWVGLFFNIVAKKVLSLRG